MTDYFTVYDLDSCPDKSQKLLSSSVENFGWIPNQSAIMALSPELLETYQKAHDCFNETELNDVEKSIVWLTVAYAHYNSYSIAAHRYIARKSGVDGELLRKIEMREQLPMPLGALREFTESVVLGLGGIENKDLDKFLASGYTRKAVFEVVLGVSQKFMANFVNSIAGTPIDDIFAEAGE